jgi:hypothetical protein
MEIQAILIQIMPISVKLAGVVNRICYFRLSFVEEKLALIIDSQMRG